MKSVVVQFRCTEEIAAAYKVRADKLEMSVAEWIRITLEDELKYEPHLDPETPPDGGLPNSMRPAHLLSPPIGNFDKDGQLIPDPLDMCGSRVKDYPITNPKGMPSKKPFWCNPKKS